MSLRIAWHWGKEKQNKTITTKKKKQTSGVKSILCVSKRDYGSVFLGHQLSPLFQVLVQNCVYSTCSIQYEADKPISLSPVIMLLLWLTPQKIPVHSQTSFLLHL